MNYIKIYSNDEIISASYGILDKYKDVSDFIKNIFIKNVNYPILLSSKLFNFDPYFGKMKELIIICKSKQLVIKDNSYIEYKIIQSVEEIIPVPNIIITPNILKNNIMHERITNILNPIKITNYIISTNARDENNIIEWIIYHLLIGFDKVVIIDHKSIKSIKQLIEPYKWKHRVEIIKSELDGCVKMHFLNKIIIPYMIKNCKKYFIHLDADEYIYIKDTTIDKMLSNYNCNILALNWLMFGSNNKDTNDNKYKCVIPTFTKSDTNIHNHFKCFIKINKSIEFTFINPHHILFKKQSSVYTNVLNKSIQFTGNSIKHFEDMKPCTELNKLPCYINHYIVQSKEDYINRKINRPRDDTNTTRDYELEILSHYNSIINNNLINYVDTIYHMIDTCKFQFGFIMIRYVNSIATNEMWQICYHSIRRFYSNLIIIIDDNSLPEYLTNIECINCTIIKSEFPKRGELLPYYYYIKNKYFDRAIIIHDSMKINQYYDFTNIVNYKNYTRLFSFNNCAYKTDISFFKEATTYLAMGTSLYQYHLNNINRMIGCFGVCYIIDYDYIIKIENKYKISNLVKFIDTRPKRQTLERLLSCLFEMDRCINNYETRTDILGSIFCNNNNIIEKHYFGR